MGMNTALINKTANDVLLKYGKELGFEGKKLGELNNEQKAMVGTLVSKELPAVNPLEILQELVNAGIAANEARRQAGTNVAHGQVTNNATGQRNAGATAIGTRFGAVATTKAKEEVGNLYTSGKWNDLVAFVEKDRGVLSDRVSFEKYLVALNKSKPPQFTKTIDEAATYLDKFVPDGIPTAKLQGLSAADVVNRNRVDVNSEVLGAVGKAFREISMQAEKGALTREHVDILSQHAERDLQGASPGELRRVALELSTKYYEAGFFADLSFYTAVNAAHNNLRLGNVARAERLCWAATDPTTQRHGGHGKEDYWLQATRLEAGLMTRESAPTVARLFAGAAKLVKNDWEAETTARTLKDTVNIYRRDTGAPPEDMALMDVVVEKLYELTKNPALAGDQAWINGAMEQIAPGSSQPMPTSDKTLDVPTLPENFQETSRKISERTVDVDWRHDKTSLDDIYQQAEGAKAQLDVVMDQIAKDVGGKAVHAPLKGRARAEEKIADLAGDASRLVDVARGTLEFNSIEQLYDALGRLDQDARVNIVGIKDRFDRPYSSGYRDVLLKVRMENGHVAELQLHLKSILEVKEGPGHDLYVKQRAIWAEGAKQGGTLNTEQRAQLAALDEEMKKLYDGAYMKGLKTDAFFRG